MPVTGDAAQRPLHEEIDTVSTAQIREALGQPPAAEAPAIEEDGPIKWNAAEGVFETTFTVGEKTQRFIGKTIGAVAAQLVKAQVHASEKILELSSKKKNVQVDKTIPGFTPIEFRPRKLEQAELLALADGFQSNPELAFEKVFEARMGCKPEMLAASMQQTQNLYARRLADEAAYEFLANHTEDYEANPQNTDKLYNLLKTQGLPVTLNNLEYAFQTLSEQGIKFVKETPPTEEEPEEIQTPQPPVTLTGRSARAELPATPRGRDVDAARMPLADLKALIQQQGRKAVR